MLFKNNELVMIFYSFITINSNKNLKDISNSNDF